MNDAGADWLSGNGSPDRDEAAEDRDAARLAGRAQAGDDAAFSDLYIRYFDRVYGYMKVALRDQHEAEDCAQQVFANAWTSLGDYECREETPFRAWLFRIARNEAVSHLRKAGRIEYQEPSAIDRRLEDETADAAEALGPGPGHQWLTDHELLIWVERLPVAQRQALTLRYLLDLSPAEVAAVLGHSPDNIRQMEHRALRFLRQRMEEAGRGSGDSRRSKMQIRTRPQPVLTARRWSLLTGEGRASALFE